MSGPISFGGLASGIDTNAIISALVQAERIPIQQLESQRAQEQGKKNLFGQLDGLLSNLRSKADELSSSSGFLANTVTPSQEGIASFTPTGGALAGSYSLEVLSLASASRYELTAQSSPTTDLGGVDISFDIGDGDGDTGTQAYSISLDAGSSSLNDIADAINTDLADVARATVINTGTDSSPSYSLVIESASTGEENAIAELVVDSAGGTIDVENTLSTAANAQIELNGLTIERSTNEFGDVIDGLGFTVEALTETDTPITFNVGVDDETVLASLDEFVGAYNAVMSFINTQSEYTEAAGAGGPLFGDPALRQIRSTLSNTLFSDSLIDSSSSYGSLGLLGIDIGTDGTLSIDDAQVAERLAEDPEAFSDFFTDLDGFDNDGAEEGTSDYYVDTTSDTGLFSQLAKNLDALLDDQTDGSGEKLLGLINRREETLQNNVDRINDRIDALEFRLEGFEEGLVAQYAALEESLASLNSQQAFLGALGQN